MVQWWYKLVGKKTVYTLSISSKLKNGGNVIKREINGEVDLCLT